MPQQWAASLEADAALDRLPATLPDALFASKTHLNRNDQRACAARLCAELAAGP